jgi:DoxX-like family
MSLKTIKIIGWIFSGLLVIVFAGSAFMKLSQNPEAITRAASFGFSRETNFIIGLVEIVSLILFLIPRTGVIGGMFLVAYNSTNCSVDYDVYSFSPSVTKIVIKSWQ